MGSDDKLFGIPSGGPLTGVKYGSVEHREAIAAAAQAWQRGKAEAEASIERAERLGFATPLDDGYREAVRGLGRLFAWLLAVAILVGCAAKPGDACSGDPVMGVWQRGSCGDGLVCARGACASTCELWIFHEGYDAGGTTSPFYPDGGVDPARLEEHNAPCVAALGKGAYCDGLGACAR